MRTPKRVFFDLLDAYILKYHSADFIRRELILDEISKRIDAAIQYNNKIRDEQEAAKIDSMKLSFDIERDGWIAQIDFMNKVVSDAYKLREECLNLMHRVESRAKEVAMITAENKHEGNAIIEAVAKSIGKLDIIGTRAGDVVDEITKSKNKDESALRLK